MASRSVRFDVRSRKLSNVGQPLNGCPIYYLQLLRASEGTLSRWFRLYLRSLAPTNPQWSRVVGYSPFSLCVIHKEGLCFSSGDINRQFVKQDLKLKMMLENMSLQATTSNDSRLYMIQICKAKFWRR
jgi:hypothetical protein